jgi:alpha-D-ribose 1-methylphosphonate 5-triphosphate diphosphatase
MSVIYVWHQANNASTTQRDYNVTNICLANASIILESEILHGSVHVENGKIVDITSGVTVPAGAIDIDGDYLSAGLVELHTDNLERHLKPRPGVRQPKLDAILAHDGELASTGITTVFDALRVGSVVSDNTESYEPYALETAETIARLIDSDNLRIDHHIHLRAEVCSETLTQELNDFGAAHGVGLLSLMDHTPGQRQFADTKQLERYLKGKHGMDDEQMQAHFSTLQAISQKHAEKHREDAIGFARQFGCILASHDDTTLGDVDMAIDAGCRIAEFPTTIAAAEKCDHHDIAVMMGAPNLMRGGSHSGNVSAIDLVEPGYLRILSSDYVPSTLLRAAVKMGQMIEDMARAMTTVTLAPARAVGLDDRGLIAEGLRADLVRFKLVDGTPIIRGVWSQGRQVA